MKKIISLTNVFIKEYYQSLPIFDTTNKKLNKKSIFFWLILIIFFGVAYASYEIIKFLSEIGQQELFLNLFFPVLLGILAFQSILVCANIFYFSKDIENVLYMPIKSEKMLIAKLFTMLCMLYVSEGILTVVPLALYGMLTSANFLYYFWAILIIAIFPILISTFIGILTIFIMKFAKFIKNKEIFQIIITIFLIIAIFLVEYIAVQNIFSIQDENHIINIKEKIQQINNYFLIINPSINILINPASFKAIIHFLQIIFYNFIGFTIFILFGRVTYLKDILKNMISTEIVKKKNKKINLSNKIKSKSTTQAYIKKELKLLIREPSFFMQCIFPVISLLSAAVIIIIGIYPTVMQALQDEQVKAAIDNFKFNTESICDILIILQVLFSISNISLTAISREGKNATFIKYIPIELYKQFIYKNIPQFILNLLITIVVLLLIYYIFPTINIIYMLFIFLIATLINIINCYLMLIVDLRRPNLDWVTEAAVVKRSDNKLFQYALMIVNILLLLYIANIFKEINLIIGLVAELLFYTFTFVIIDRCVKKWQKKLFEKII